MNKFWENYLNSAIQSIGMAANITTPLENVSNSAVNDPVGSHENVNISLEKYDYNDTEIEPEDTKTTHNVNELCLSRGVIIKKLQTDCNNLKKEQRKILDELESSRKAFGIVTSELKKQLDSAKQGESEACSKMLALRLENKKLEVLLESEKNLVEMLKKELLDVKRTLKFAIKDFYKVPRLPHPPDVGYEEFENLSKTPTCGHTSRVQFADSLDDYPPKKTP